MRVTAESEPYLRWWKDFFGGTTLYVKYHVGFYAFLLMFEFPIREIREGVDHVRFH